MPGNVQTSSVLRKDNKWFINEIVEKCCQPTECAELSRDYRLDKTRLFKCELCSCRVCLDGKARLITNKSKCIMLVICAACIFALPTPIRICPKVVKLFHPNESKFC